MAVPKTFDPSSSSSSDASESMCMICLSEIEKEDEKAIFTPECSHSFHFDCITKNVEEGNRSCLICVLKSANELLKKEKLELEKINRELEKEKRELENELEKKNKIFHELKEPKKNQAQEVEIGEEDIGHKDSDQGVEDEENDG